MTTTIKLNKTLLQRATEAARKAGYSSVEEFIEHAIEKQLEQYENPEAKEDPKAKKEMMRQLKGLGYID